MTYDFKTLSPEDFELLAADLFSKEFGATLEAFKPGKDQGIDLRHSRVLPGQTQTIIQCKRYAPGNFASLEQAVGKERPKLEKLKPARYILATSVALSAHNKQLLLNVLGPWCHGPEDIYGAGEINLLLRKYAEVERSHFKLWIASTSILERVIHSAIFNVTEATVEAVQAQLARLVVHGGMPRALKILNELHHVLIVGNPGIGKTTLARMLLCHYLREGFEPVVAIGDISDVWAMIQGKKNANRKFVVLYDDFLGRLKFDSERFGKNEDQSLTEFLRLVNRSNNLRFILTTREYILADARRIHEVFDTQAQNLANCVVSLDDYTMVHRAKVLFNHLYFSDLPDSRLQALVDGKVYRTIVKHKHFSPRIVEGISNYANSRAMSDAEYVRYVEKEFDDPRGVWDHPFRYQISPAARETLMLLWSFGVRVPVDALKLSYQKLHPEVPATDSSQTWHDALRSLDGNFVMTHQYPVMNQKGLTVTLAEFHNPSIQEYVDRYVSTETAWFERLLAALVSFAQVSNFLQNVERKWLKEMTPSFWIALDAAAERTEGSPTGYIVNCASNEGRVTQMWSGDERAAREDRILTRLRIASHAPFDSGVLQKLQQRLTKPEGWKSLIADISAGNERRTYGVTRLLQWISSQAEWSNEIQSAISLGFREALKRALLPSSVTCMSLESMCKLTQHVIRTGPSLMPEEKLVLADAARAAVEIAVKSSYESETLKAEAAALEELEQICGVDFSSEYELLDEEAQSAGSDPGDHYSNSDFNRYSSGDHATLDIDALFSELIDR